MNQNLAENPEVSIPVPNPCIFADRGYTHAVIAYTKPSITHFRPGVFQGR